MLNGLLSPHMPAPKAVAAMGAGVIAGEKPLGTVVGAVRAVLAAAPVWPWGKGGAGRSGSA